jgi:hypothetical protein
MFPVAAAKNVIKQLLRARNTASYGFKLKYYSDWHADLDEALLHIPEQEIFPHELFRLMMQMSDAEKKKIILVTERGEPVAVVGLRNRLGYWEPVTQWIVPGVLFPVKVGYLSRVLPSLGLEIKVAWWRWEAPPPIDSGFKNVVSTPTNGMLCSEDFEQYWKSTGQLKDIRKYRKRCEGFELKVNSPGGSEWIIRHWEAKWRPQGFDEMPDLAERLLCMQYLQERNLYYSLLLYDGDEAAAGGTLMIHRGCVVAHCSYRNPKYDWHGSMTHLNELIFAWSKEMEFIGVDLGGSFDYKNGWAPENGMKWTYDICPNNVVLEEKLAKFLRKVMISV